MLLWNVRKMGCCLHQGKPSHNISVVAGTVGAIHRLGNDTFDAVVPMNKKYKMKEQNRKEERAKNSSFFD